MVDSRTKRWTVADVDALPYDEWHRYEIIDGELFVSTAPHYELQELALNAPPPSSNGMTKSTWAVCWLGQGWFSVSTTW